MYSIQKTGFVKPFVVLIQNRADIIPAGTRIILKSICLPGFHGTIEPGFYSPAGGQKSIEPAKLRKPIPDCSPFRDIYGEYYDPEYN